MGCFDFANQSVYHKEHLIASDRMLLLYISLVAAWTVTQLMWKELDIIIAVASLLLFNDDSIHKADY